MCLLGECNDGYKCDCFGFEHYTKLVCSVFTTEANVVPSMDTEFRCHLTTDARTCVMFERFLDTVNAADNAKEEAKTVKSDTNTAMTEVSEDIKAMQFQKLAMATTLEVLETFTGEVTEQERMEVEAYVMIVVKYIRDSQTEALALQEEASEVSEAYFKIGHFHRMCHRKKKDSFKREGQENTMATKPENQKACNQCDSLKEEIKAIRQERKEAAIMAGKWTKKMQIAKNRCNKHRDNVQKIRLSVEEARVRCVSCSQQILSRMHQQDLKIL